MTRQEEQSIAERLRAALMARRMSQSELARHLAGPRASQKKIANKRRQIVRWVNGQSLPDPDNAARLAGALGTPTDEFVTTPEVRPSGVARALREIDARFAAYESRLATLERALQDALASLRDGPTGRSRKRRGT